MTENDGSYYTTSAQCTQSGLAIVMCTHNQCFDLLFTSPIDALVGMAEKNLFFKNQETLFH